MPACVQLSAFGVVSEHWSQSVAVVGEGCSQGSRFGGINRLWFDYGFD